MGWVQNIPYRDYKKIQRALLFFSRGVLLPVLLIIPAMVYYGAIDAIAVPFYIWAGLILGMSLIPAAVDIAESSETMRARRLCAKVEPIEWGF